MANIPTIPLSSVPTAQIGAPRANAEAFAAPYRALVNVGGAISDVAQTVNKYAVMKQEHHDNGLLAKEENIRLETAARIEAELDPAKKPIKEWGTYIDDTWREYELARTKRLKEDGWSERAAEVDGIKYNDERTRLGIQYKTHTDKAQINEDNTALTVNMEQNISAGKVEAAFEAIDKMSLSPVNKVALKADVLPKLQYQVGLQEVAADPFLAEEKIKAGKGFEALNQERRIALLNQARNGMNNERIDVANSLQERRLAGDTIPDDELMALAETRRINAVTAKAIIKEQKRMAKEAEDGAKAMTPEVKAYAAKVLTLVNTYDADGDKDNSRFIDLGLMIAAMPTGIAMEEATARLRAKDTERKQGGGNPVKKDIDRQMSELFDKGHFGKTKPDFAGDKFDAVEALPAYDKFNRAKDLMEKWWLDHPAADRVVAFDEFKRLTLPNYVANAREAIAPKNKTLGPVPISGQNINQGRSALEILGLYRLDQPTK
jgi:hypothetical protein